MFKKLLTPGRKLRLLKIWAERCEPEDGEPAPILKPDLGPTQLLGRVYWNVDRYCWGHANMPDFTVRANSKMVGWTYKSSWLNDHTAEVRVKGTSREKSAPDMMREVILRLCEYLDWKIRGSDNNFRIGPEYQHMVFSYSCHADREPHLQACGTSWAEDEECPRLVVRYEDPNIFDEVLWFVVMNTMDRFEHIYGKKMQRYARDVTRLFGLKWAQKGFSGDMTGDIIAARGMLIDGIKERRVVERFIKRYLKKEPDFVDKAQDGFFLDFERGVI